MSTDNGSEKSFKSTQNKAHSFVGATIPLLAYHYGGYNYRGLKREGNVGLFEQLTIGGKSVAYEVIIIQSNQKKEYAPKTEDWGKLGWSFSQYENAIKAFKELSDETE